MPKCRVRGCDQNTYKGVRTHRFPYKTDIDRARQWLILCKIRFDDIATFKFDNMVICGKHFTEDDYEDDMQARILGYKRPVRLKDTAVPSLLLPEGPSTIAKRRKQRKRIPDLFETAEQDVRPIVHDPSGIPMQVVPISLNQALPAVVSQGEAGTSVTSQEMQGSALTEDSEKEIGSEVQLEVHAMDPVSQYTILPATQEGQEPSGLKRPGEQHEIKEKKRIRKRSEDLRVQQSRQIRVDIDIFLRLTEIRIKRKLDTINDVLFILLERYDLSEDTTEDAPSLQDPACNFNAESPEQLIEDLEMATSDIDASEPSYDLNQDTKEDMPTIKQEPVSEEHLSASLPASVEMETRAVTETSSVIPITGQESCEQTVDEARKESVIQSESHVEEKQNSNTEVQEERQESLTSCEVDESIIQPQPDEAKQESNTEVQEERQESLTSCEVDEQSIIQPQPDRAKQESNTEVQEERQESLTSCELDEEFIIQPQSDDKAKQESCETDVSTMKEELAESFKVSVEAFEEESVIQPELLYSEYGCETDVSTMKQDLAESFKVAVEEAVDEESVIQPESLNSEQGENSANPEHIKHGISKDHTYTTQHKSQQSRRRKGRKPTKVMLQVEKGGQEITTSKEDVAKEENELDPGEVFDDFEEFEDFEDFEEEDFTLGEKDDKRDDDYDPSEESGSEWNMSDSDSDDDYMRPRKSRRSSTQKKTTKSSSSKPGKKQPHKESQNEESKNTKETVNWHTFPSKYRCRLCEEECLHLVDMKQHLDSAHSNQQAPMPKKHQDKVVKEKMMGKVDPSDVLGDFEVSALSFLVRLCSTCDKYIPETQIAAHLDSHGPLVLVCEFCGKGFKNSTKLYNHKKQCNNDAPTKRYKCKICGKDYCTKAGRKNHFQSQHLTGRGRKVVHQCERCGKEFKSNANLKAHMPIHLTVKPFECPECGKGFAQKTNMEYHRRVHSGEKPYKCDMCQEAYAHNVSLKTHKKKKHGIDMWKIPGDTA